ncbi:MAG: GIY-YIG nuclease family protein [Henriciella sp.]
MSENESFVGKAEVPGFQQFEFELTDALIDQLATVLTYMSPADLTTEMVGRIPDGQGVYQLFLNGELVYIGKTDSDAGLSERLLKHALKVSGRPSLRNDVQFKAVQVLVFSAMELETLLIRRFKSQGQTLAWQHSGFGSNDPGRRRDTTEYKDSHFDVLHPIDIDEPSHFQFEADTTVQDALKSLKEVLPYTLRFANHTDLSSQALSHSINATSVRDAVEQLVSSLPEGWQATNLPGYVILYKETKTYQHGKIIANS